MSPFDASAFVVCLLLGLYSRHALARVFVYTLPYIAGNFFYTVHIPINIGRSSEFALIALGCFGIAGSQRAMKGPFKRAGDILAVTSLLTVGGLVWVLATSDTLELWLQTPLERAIRSTLREITFWLVPIAVANSIKNAAEARVLLRDFILAGVVYSLLGLGQFAIASVTGVDIFPITRLVENSLQLQNMVGDGTQGRITSICGEPRYFSSFLTAWMFLTVMIGSVAGFRPMQVGVLSFLFLFTNILTASRSGLAGAVMILAAMIVVSLVVGEEQLRRRANQLIAVVLVGAAASALISGLAIRDRIGSTQDLTSDRITIGGYDLPIEYQDDQALRLFIEKPASLVRGFGNGLWQYSTDPSSNLGFKRGYFEQGVAGIDSMRQNISALGFLVNYGIIGVWAALQFYKECFRISGANRVLRRQFRPAAITLIAATFSAATTDVYCHVMFIVVIMLWHQNHMENLYGKSRDAGHIPTPQRQFALGHLQPERAH